jgi:ATP-dependent protease ClpP protease subunit
MNLFRQNEQVGKLKMEMKDDSTTVVMLYDVIGDWFGVSAKDFNKSLSAVNTPNIELRINSPGGDVFDARAIATALRNHPSKVTAYIDGVCASAATYIALSADTVHMAVGAFFMVHNAWTLAMGNADDFDATSSLLRKVDASIVADYVRKTGKSETEIKQVMDYETWFTAEEALAYGFVDHVDTGELGAKNLWDLSSYDKAPKAIAESEEVLHNREKFERRLKLFESTNG